MFGAVYGAIGDEVLNTYLNDVVTSIHEIKLHLFHRLSAATIIGNSGSK